MACQPMGDAMHRAMGIELRQFETRLMHIEGRLGELEAEAQEMSATADTMRQDLSTHSLATVAEHVCQSLRSAAGHARHPQRRAWLRTLQELVREPQEWRRMCAYEQLSAHDAQHKNTLEGTCSYLARALLLLRDLLVLTICIGRAPITREGLVSACGDAMLKGCGRAVLSYTEQSQLCLAWSKVVELGRVTSREVFERRVRSPTMYGPAISSEVVDMLLVVYNTAARTSPEYQSLHQSSPKYKNAKPRPNKKERAELAGMSVEHAGEATQHEEASACEPCIHGEPDTQDEASSVEPRLRGDTGVVEPDRNDEVCGLESWVHCRRGTHAHVMHGMTREGAVDVPCHNEAIDRAAEHLGEWALLQQRGVCHLERRPR